MRFRELIQDPSATIDTIASYLDGLSAEDRLKETRTLSRDEQRKLYQRAEKAALITLDDFVPADMAKLSPLPTAELCVSRLL